jgi:O-antigen/teichoic acid export membrane protein
LTRPSKDVDPVAIASDASWTPGGAAGTAGSRVGHNAILNFLALAVPLALAFLIMPIAARHLGPARFGLLGLAWAVTEYLTLFDLGLGRALVKFVADALHHDSTQLSEIVSLSMAAQVLAGIVGGLVFALAAPVLVSDVFRIAPELAIEARRVFQVVGLSVPIVLLISGQRAVLEGAQRFDLSATLKMVSSIGAISIPAVGAVLGASLPVILLVVLLSRIVVSIAFAVAIRVALPSLRWVRSRDWGLLRRVLSFGGWVLVSNTVNPLLVYFDRFALGTIVGLAAVGLYTAPYEGVTRMLLIPVSLFSSLLPALTSIEARRERERFGALVASSERLLAPVMAIPLALVLVFAPELLQAWLGAQYAQQSSTALRILAAGVFANSLAHPLFVVLYAKGRPDLPAKFHLAELVIHIPLTIFLIQSFGIAGAAAAWTTRVTLDMCLLLWGAARTSGLPILEVAGGRVGTEALGILLLFGALIASKHLAVISGAASLTAVVATIVLFAAGSWGSILQEPERAALRHTLRSYMKPLKVGGIW